MLERHENSAGAGPQCRLVWTAVFGITLIKVKAVTVNWGAAEKTDNVQYKQFETLTFQI